MPSLITGIIGGAQTRNAVSDAEKAQIAAALKAQGIVDQATGEVNPQILQAAINAVSGVDTAAGNAAAGVEQAGQQANEQLNPYTNAGQQAVSTLLQRATEGGGSQPFQFDPSQDPRTQFQLQQGQQAIERSAAARGGLLGGGTLKSLTRYASGVAGDSFDAAYARYDKDRSANLADRSLGLNALSGIAGLGAGAAERVGTNLIGTATRAGDYRLGAATYGGDTMQRAVGRTTDNTMNAAGFRADMATEVGNAQAAGSLGRANAWNGMLNQIGRTGDAAISGGFGAAGSPFSIRGMARGAVGRRY